MRENDLLLVGGELSMALANNALEHLRRDAVLLVRRGVFGRVGVRAAQQTRGELGPAEGEHYRLRRTAAAP